MSDDERIMEHFNANAKPCRHSKDKPRLSYEPGCWTINCKDGCKCQISDGDNASSTPILTRWNHQQQG